MGSAQTKFLEKQLANVPGEIKPKKLGELQNQGLYEYPFLAHIFESVLICDNRLPDCPIVYCNDLFEQMTLYPKEEIIGRNCRFLQGPASNQKIVQLIRKAVDEGLEIDVEILNYRKDGVPFFNNFLMLPVHAPRKREGEVHFFIAIQKDITVLRQPGSDPKAWSQEEVAMWLYHISLVDFSAKFFQNNIDGAQLFTLTPNEIASLLPASEAKILNEKIEQILANPDLAFNYPKEEIKYIPPSKKAKLKRSQSGSEGSKKEEKEEKKDEVEVVLGESVAITARPWWRSVEFDKSSNDGGESFREKVLQSVPASNGRMTLKFFFRKTIKVINVPETIKFSELQELVRDSYQIFFKLKYKDFDGEFIDLDDDASLEAAKLCAVSSTVGIKISKKLKQLSKSKRVYLNVAPIGLAVVDSEYSIVLLNPVVEKHLQVKSDDLYRKDFSSLFEGKLDFQLTGKPQKVTYKGKKIALTVSSEKVDFNYIVVVA